ASNKLLFIPNIIIKRVAKVLIIIKDDVCRIPINHTGLNRGKHLAPVDNGGLIAQSLYGFHKWEYGRYPYLDTLCLFYSHRIFVARSHTIKTLWPGAKEL